MATYWVKSGQGGTDAGTSWANAAESLGGLLAAQAIAGGDIIYVHNTHTSVYSASKAFTIPESGGGSVQVLCVDGGDATGASLVDGTVGSLTTGASESTNGNFYIQISSTNLVSARLFVHGLAFSVGSGVNESSADLIMQPASSGVVKFSACSFTINSTSSTALFYCGAVNPSVHEYENCTFKFGATTQGIGLGGAFTCFRNCKLDSSGSIPTTTFSSLGTSGSSSILNLECTGCDWSGSTNLFAISTITHAGKALFSNCAIAANPVTGTLSYLASMEVECHACAAGDGTNGANILRYYKNNISGIVQDDQTVYKATGGAQGEQDDGTDTPYSLKLDPSSSVAIYSPLYTPWIYKLVDSTGDKTVTMKIAHTESAVLLDKDVFMEVQYMGEPGATGTQRIANSPHALFEVDDACPVQSGTIYRDAIATGSNRTDDAIDDWTGITSEKEHTLTASINCAEIGYIRCRVGLTKDTTNSVYVDPKIGVA